jgi:ABC-2 type transport system permease protein
MAVYRRNYRAYSGPVTSMSSRWMVLFRYAKRNLFSSKIQIGFFVVCFFYPFAALVMIYLAHSASFLASAGIPSRLISIDNDFFLRFMNVQGTLAFLMTAFAGPGLISPDLANGAMPLYFCRPLSRADYVFGKSSALALLLSEITWIPGLVLFAIQASLAGVSWTFSNLWMVASLFVSSMLWITLLCLLAMAFSAWVKWRVVAGALLLALMFFGAGFGQAINAVLRIDAGNIFNVAYLMNTIWSALFQTETDHAIPLGEAAIALLTYGGACLALLMKKVRAYEVVA